MPDSITQRNYENPTTITLVAYRSAVVVSAVGLSSKFSLSKVVYVGPLADTEHKKEYNANYSELARCLLGNMLASVPHVAVYNNIQGGPKK